MLRFWNNDVLNNIESVLESIQLQLLASPLPEGEGQGEGGYNSPKHPQRLHPFLSAHPRGEGLMPSFPCINISVDVV